MCKASEGIGGDGINILKALANDQRKIKWWQDYAGEQVNKDSESISKRKRRDDPAGGTLAVNDPNAGSNPGDTGFPGQNPGDTGFPPDLNDPGAPGSPPLSGNIDPPSGGINLGGNDPVTGGAQLGGNDHPSDPMTGGTKSFAGNDPMTGGSTPITSGLTSTGLDPMTGGGMKVSGLTSVATARGTALRPAYLPNGVMPKPNAMQWLASRGDESSFALKQALSGRAA